MASARPRLLQTEPSQLVLEHFWIEQLRYEEREPSSADAAPPVVRASRPRILHDPGNAASFLVRMRLQVSAGADREVDVTAAGVFRLDEATPASSPEGAAFVHVNAPVMLVGSIRGALAAVTGMTGMGRLDLPSLNLSTLLD